MVFTRQVLRCDTHGDITRIAVFQFEGLIRPTAGIFLAGFDEARIVARIEAAHGDARHVFDTTRDKHIAKSRHNILRCHVDCLQAGGAEAVDGDATRCFRQASEGADEAREVHSLLALWEGTTKDDIFDKGTIKLRDALNGCFYGNGGQVVGAYIFEYAFIGAADRSAYSTHDYCILHWIILLYYAFNLFHLDSEPYTEGRSIGSNTHQPTDKPINIC